MQVPVIVQNDAVTALSGGTLGNLSGVILIAGTGQDPLHVPSWPCIDHCEEIASESKRVL